MSLIPRVMILTHNGVLILTDHGVMNLILIEMILNRMLASRMLANGRPWESDSHAANALIAEDLIARSASFYSIG